ncbi:hypothetical protein [Streptomyces sp. V4I8]|uniref:hypothetical protein n=1 Tax=Streptomyces sp. V4I8 TaxID=3156469 RepID=UPI0035129A18
MRRIALIDPPWFDDELNRLGRGYYEDAGFAVVFSAPCALLSGQHLIRPGDLHDWVSGHTPHDAEAVVVGGNGFRVVGTVERLEQTLRRPVLTANQTLLWAALRATGLLPRTSKDSASCSVRPPLNQHRISRKRTDT